MGNQLMPRVSTSDVRQAALQHLSMQGVVVVQGLLPVGLVEELASEVYEAHVRVKERIGERRLKDAGEIGVVRAPLAYSQVFIDVLAHESILEIAEAVVGKFCIAHLQNGFVLPSAPQPLPTKSPTFQGRWHQDFPRIVGGTVLSVNSFIPLSRFSTETGATEFLVGTHQREGFRPDGDQEVVSVSAEAEPGDVIFFDSTIWHRAGVNTSKSDRLALNQQYTPPWIKQQLDLCRLMPRTVIAAQPDKLQRVIGFHSRPPASLDEFYVPIEDRTYRGGQG